MALLEDGDFAQATVPLARRRGSRPRRPRSARRSAAPTSEPPYRGGGGVRGRRRAHPVNDYAHFCLGRALTYCGERERARHHLALASNLRPDRSDYRLYRDRCARPSAEPLRALVQRVSQRRGRRSRASASRRSAPGCWCCSALRTRTTAEEADRLADKVRELRIFDDAEGRMNEPLGEREVLCVSQFTLYGDTRKGNRPSYIAAARPEQAEPLYERFCERLGRQARRLRRRHGASSWSMTGR